jgi:hypothetical protein
VVATTTAHFNVLTVDFSVVVNMPPPPSSSPTLRTKSHILQADVDGLSEIVCVGDNEHTRPKGGCSHFKAAEGGPGLTPHGKPRSNKSAGVVFAVCQHLGVGEILRMPPGNQERWVYHWIAMVYLAAK